MACDRHGLVPSEESGIYKCVECGDLFNVTPAIPVCQLCGERDGNPKVHVDALYFTGNIHSACLDDFTDICREMELDEEGQQVFFDKKVARWQK